MEYVTLGRIVNVRGLKGEMKVKSFTDFARQRYQVGNELLLANEENKDAIKVHVEKYVEVGDLGYVIFAEISDVDTANQYRNYLIKYAVEKLEKLEKDTYYYHQLIGLKVYMNGVCKGEVIKLRDDTAQKSLVVIMPSGKKEVVPFVKAFIAKVDIDNKRIDVHNWEGLFNEN